MSIAATIYFKAWAERERPTDNGKWPLIKAVANGHGDATVISRSKEVDKIYDINDVFQSLVALPINEEI